jgi:hypothetical protein
MTDAIQQQAAHASLQTGGNIIQTPAGNRTVALVCVNHLTKKVTAAIPELGTHIVLWDGADYDENMGPFMDLVMQRTNELVASNGIRSV